MNASEFPGYFFLVIKAFVLIGLFVYGVFAAIMVRQEQLMAHVLEEMYEPFVRTMTFIHLVGAIIIFFIALVIL